MKKQINRTKLTNIVLHSLATQHLSRAQLLRKVMLEHDNVSDRTISYHFNYMIDAQLISRNDMTSKQFYSLTTAGCARYLELLSNVSDSIKVK